MALPFLTAMKNVKWPAHVRKAAEKSFTVTYILGNCRCEEHQRLKKTVQALSRSDAIEQFKRFTPLAWVISVD